jgi:hypothetical protein
MYIFLLEKNQLECDPLMYQLVCKNVIQVSWIVKNVVN